MGIDFGLKRTGISVTDPMQIIVQGLDTQKTEDVLEFIVRYAGREPVDAFVVGYPFLEGAWGDKPFKVKLDSFIKALKKNFPDTDVHLQDERNSSMRAREIIIERGTPKKKRQDKSLMDKTSAIIILQEYLGHI